MPALSRSTARKPALTPISDLPYLKDGARCGDDTGYLTFNNARYVGLSPVLLALMSLTIVSTSSR